MSILCYHTVDDSFRSRLSLTPDQFDEHCRWLAADRDVVSLSTALELMDARGRLPRGVVTLTFDDGLEGLYRHAYPTLVKYGLPATVFLVTDTLTGAHPHVDWIDGTPPGVLQAMTRDQILEMARDGIVFGSHSSEHFDLPSLDPVACEDDLRRSRLVLENLLDTPVENLAYPRGRHSTQVRELARQAGFVHAYSLPEGREQLEDLAIPRVGVYAHNSLPTVRLKSSRYYLPLRMGAAYPLARSAVRSLRNVGRAARTGTTPGSETWVQGNATSSEVSISAGRAHVAYIMSRFPKISETFILNEILEVRRQGVRVDVYPLLREHQPVAHPEAELEVERAHFEPFMSPSIAASNMRAFRRQPAVYVRMIWDVLRGTAGSLNFFVGAIGILPKVVKMARQMERDGVGHVHCHFATHPPLAGLIIHRLTGIPFSFTAHGSDLHVERRMLRQKVAEAAFVVAISEFNRQIIADECAPADLPKVHVVHCGIDTDQFVAVPRRPSAGTFRVLCVGTLEEVKGQRHLLDACADLHGNGIAVSCRIVGDGPDRSGLEEQARRLGLTAKVRFLGSLPREGVIDELQAADVLVAPSVPTAGGKREGIPVVLMEAMATELPVVASNLSGIPELVDHGRSGLLVPPGDVPALAEALRVLRDDPALRTRLGRSGRIAVEDGFSLPRSVSQLCRLMGVGGDEPSRSSTST